MDNREKLLETDPDMAKMKIISAFRSFRSYLKTLLYAEDLRVMPGMELRFVARQEFGDISSPEIGSLAVKTSAGMLGFALRADGMLVRPGGDIYGEGARPEFLAHEIAEDMKRFRFALMRDIGVDGVDEQIRDFYGNYVRLEGFPQADVA